MKQDETDRYPLLREYLTLKGMALKPAFTVHDIAQMFDVTPRTIQSWIAIGKVNTRDVPGRAKIFPADLEEMLARLRQPEQSQSPTVTPITEARPVPQRAEGVGLISLSTKRHAQVLRVERPGRSR